MYHLNTTRHLATPANDRTVARLRGPLEDEILSRPQSHGHYRTVARWEVG